MTDEFESVMSDEAKYKITRQLARLVALKWTADQGRPVPPWRDAINSDGWVDEDLVEILQLWFPDLKLITEWAALPTEVQAWVREDTGTPLEHEPDNYHILYWPWADQHPDHARLIDTCWLERMANVQHFAGFRAPYISLFTEDLFLGEDNALELAHHCQALRTVLESYGYHDPEEDAAP